MKAGEFAPPLTWSKILRPIGASGEALGNYHGRLTVIAFAPNVTANRSLVSRWNELIAQFADQPVCFIWVASEEPSRIEPWLESHPIDGWLVFDPTGESALRFGIDPAGGVIVDAEGKIAGFNFIIPTEEVIRAVQQGRTVRPGLIEAEPPRHHFHQEPKPDIPPSFEVHISPSTTNGTVSAEGPDRYIQRGFELKELISKLYERDSSRIVLPSELDNGDRYDLVLLPPQGMEREALGRLLQQGIEKHFRLSAAIEEREEKVYVMTATEGRTPAANDDDDCFSGGFIGWSGGESATLRPKDGQPVTEEMLCRAMAHLGSKLSNSGITNISAHNTDMASFRRSLEQGLQRPIVDETNMTGRYDLEVRGRAKSTEEFLQMLHDQTGLLLTPADRAIEMLVFTSVVRK